METAAIRAIIGYRGDQTARFVQCKVFSHFGL